MTMPWETEFDPSYDVPAVIAEEPSLTDLSWHNDACPCFGNDVPSDKRRALATQWLLWVEHPDPTRRAFPGPRFLLTMSNQRHKIEDRVLYRGDDAAEVVAVYQRLS